MQENLSYEELGYKNFFDVYYRKKRYSQNELSFVEKALKSYAAEIKEAKNEGNSASILVKFLARIGLDGAQTDVPNSDSGGNSTTDLGILKDAKNLVLIEAKDFVSKDMFSPTNFNCKSLHQAILYYFRERKENHNDSIKFVIITNFYRFYIFKASEFQRLFGANKIFNELYESFTDKTSLFSENDKKARTQAFYNECEIKLTSPKYLNSIAKNDLFDKLSLKGFCLDLEPLIKIGKIALKVLVSALKLFHKDFLFGEFNPNDANTLNQAFYDELLYILGLCEQKDGKKTLIKPSKESLDDKGTFYNAILTKLPSNKRNFETAMQFIVLWLNRVLFLKLIEANLVKFNSDKSLKFLNTHKIENFQILSHLFFEILAKQHHARSKSQHTHLNYLPYLNSSLFAKAPCEETLLDISSLSNADFEYYSKTQIKDKNTKKKAGRVKLLDYLFEFLDSFDFGSDESELENDLGEDSQAPTNQTDLISSSVLGLIFEKLNGYKEGSYFTPSHITTYMCAISLEKVLLQKFKEAYPKNFEHIQDFGNLADEVRHKIQTKPHNNNEQNALKAEFIALLNSIRICDPAVGSGHFIATALNKMIKIHYDLGLFAVQNINLYIKNEEIHIDGFAYETAESPTKALSHKIQKALFNLKRQIIENNLFGVDINPNSVEICRLRLWIELLKSSYYLQSGDEGFNSDLGENFHQMQTLPNIDINIKCGNSLVSRFDLKDTIKDDDIKEQIKQYKKLIYDYKNADKKQLSKGDFQANIDELKTSFSFSIAAPKIKNELIKKIKKHQSLYSNYLLEDTTIKGLGGITKNIVDYDLNKAEKEKAENSAAQIMLLRIKLDNALKSKHQDELYKEAFEWRFEFPEVLDEKGDFMGFDLIIGNPPYISTLDLSKSNAQNKDIYRKIYPSVSGLYDIYLLFVLLGLKLKTKFGCFAWIIPNKFLVAKYAKKTLDMLIKKKLLGQCVDVSSVKVFKNASVYPVVILGNDNANFQRYYIDEGDDLLAENLKQKTHIEWDRFKTFAEFGIKIQSGLAGFQAHSIIEFLSNKKQENSIPFAVSGSIDRYSLDTREVKYMKRTYNNPHIVPNNAISSDKWDFWCSEKIIIAGMTKQLEAYYVKTPLAIGVGVYAIYEFTGLNPLLILGLLNSKFMSYVFTNKFQDKHLAGGYLGINKNNLETLPIPQINSQNSKIADKIINLVEQILALRANVADNSQLQADLFGLAMDKKSKAKKAPSQQSLEMQKLLEKQRALETQIDTLVYALYTLTPTEIALINTIP